MTRNSKRFAAIGGAFYVFLMWSAYRWEKSQHLPDGTIFDHIENERRAKLALAKPPEPAPPPTDASRLEAGGPALVAARYDASHVVFIVGADTQPRFGSSAVAAVKIPAPAQPAAKLADLQELWQPDAQSLPEIIKHTTFDQPPILQASAGLNFLVTPERPIVAATGCSLSAGFLASVPPNQQAAFAAAGKDYFVVRRSLPDSVASTRATEIGELHDWKRAPDFEKQIASLLAGRMKEELSKIDAWLAASAQNPDYGRNGWVAGSPRSRLEWWREPDASLARGNGKLTYDVAAFRLTPDGVPRLFVRARWQLNGQLAFLMTAWFRADAKPVLLSADSSWSRKLRAGDFDDSTWSGLDFQSVLNEFDADHDGWAELLVYTHDGDLMRIALYLYSDNGLIPTKTSLQWEAKSGSSCVEQGE